MTRESTVATARYLSADGLLQVGSELIVDLRGQLIETLDDFWDTVSKPCGLPEWFGRNLDAWSDTRPDEESSKVECGLVSDGELVRPHGEAAPLLESGDAPLDGIALGVGLSVKTGRAASGATSPQLMADLVGGLRN